MEFVDSTHMLRMRPRSLSSFIAVAAPAVLVKQCGEFLAETFCLLGCYEPTCLMREHRSQVAGSYWRRIHQHIALTHASSLQDHRQEKGIEGNPRDRRGHWLTREPNARRRASRWASQILNDTDAWMAGTELTDEDLMKTARAITMV